MLMRCPEVVRTLVTKIAVILLNHMSYSPPRYTLFRIHAITKSHFVREKNVSLMIKSFRNAVT